jgi:hypothetical protein
MKEITLTAEEIQVVLNALLNTQARISFDAIMVINNKLSSNDGGKQV